MEGTRLKCLGNCVAIGRRKQKLLRWLEDPLVVDSTKIFQHREWLRLLDAFALPLLQLKHCASSGMLINSVHCLHLRDHYSKGKL